MHLHVGQQPKNALIASDGDKGKDSFEQMQLSKLCNMKNMITKKIKVNFYQEKNLAHMSALLSLKSFLHYRKITQEVKINCVILPPAFHEFRIKSFMLRKSCCGLYFLLCFLTTT